MKLEIDINDRQQLDKLRIELSGQLKVVEFAIKELDARKKGNNQPVLNLGLSNGNGHASRGKFDVEVQNIIKSLPHKFTTTDVMIGMGDNAKENRGSIKLALKRAEDANVIVVLKKGQGRRPTKYEKVPGTEHMANAL